MLRMRLETILAGICVVGAGFANYMVGVFALHTKYPDLPGAEFYRFSVQAFKEKYPIKLYPARSLVLLAWTTIFILNFLSAILLFIGSIKRPQILDTCDEESMRLHELCQAIFGLTVCVVLMLFFFHCLSYRVHINNTYFSWMIQTFGLVAWTLSFDQELHLLTFIILIIEFLSCCSSMTSVCLSSVKSQSHKDSESIGDTFQWWIILTNFALFLSWTTFTFATTANFVLSYKDSASSSKLNAQTRAICSFENCALISLLLLIVPYLCWTAVDLYFYPTCTESVKVFYPSVAIFSIAYFFSNYDNASGITPSNIILIVLGLLALATWLLRPLLVRQLPEEKLKIK